MIDGVETLHLTGQIDLEQAASDLGPLFGAVATACGLPTNLGDLQTLQTGLAGATLSIDAYLQQPGNFPRRIGLNLDVPVANVQFSFQADLTPNATSSPILPPVQ